MSLSSMPRPALIAGIGIVLLLGFFVMTRGGGGGSSSKFKTPAPAGGTPKSSTDGAGGSATSGGSSSTKDKSTTQAPTKEKSDSASSTTTDVAQAPAGKNGLPKDVQTALNKHQVVVILFWRPEGVDDRQVHDSVQGLRGRTNGTKVFTEPVSQVDRYVAIVGPDGISQTPALVVVNTKGKVDVQTGFIDEKTVENTVYNANKHKK